MLFDNLTTAEMRKIEKIGRIKVFNQGQVIIEEHAVGNSFYFIVSGAAEVKKHIHGAKYKKLVGLTTGDVIGEIGFLGVDSRSASVVAFTDCELLEFDRVSFERFMERHPRIGLKTYRCMARELARRLAQADEDLMDTILWGLDQKSKSTIDYNVNIPKRTKLSMSTQGLGHLTC